MKKISAIIISLLICVSTFLCTSCNDNDKEQTKKSTCELAIIDTASVYKLQAFLKANEKINQARLSLEQSYSEKMKDASESQKADLNALFEKDLQSVINKEINPLKDRVQASIALVATEKKITIVMDKSVVVTGAEDITDAVKDKFREEGDLNAPDVEIGENSSVAYFDQDVVRSLPMFRDSDKKMREAWTKAREDIANKSKTMTDEQIRVLTADYEKKLKAMNDSISVPLLKKVNDTVSEVAKEKKYLLVVGKEYVMYGGKNITDEVVDRLLGKKSSSTSSSKDEK